MNRKSVTRRRRKYVMKYGTITREELLNKDDDSRKWPDRRDWGYAVDVKCNGYNITSCGRNRFEAMQGAVECVRWALEMPYGKGEYQE